jgi:hypothetical protein
MTEGEKHKNGVFRHLGVYSDWVAHAKTQTRLYPEVDRPGLTSADVRALLGFGSDGEPLVPQQGRHWTHNGVAGEEVSWSAGYGPRTEAWLLRPADAEGPLPGVLALHARGTCSHAAMSCPGRSRVLVYREAAAAQGCCTRPARRWQVPA